MNSLFTSVFHSFSADRYVVLQVVFILKQIELFMQWCKCGVYKPVIRCHFEVWNFRNKFLNKYQE